MAAVREAVEGSGNTSVSPHAKDGPAALKPESRLYSKSRLLLRVLASIAFIAATTFVLYRVVPVNPTTAGFLYIVAILFIATKGGLLESTAASVVAMLCLNFFFFPPVRTLTIADPQNWVALFAFVATSLTASQLSASAKRRATEAELRRGEVERLYALGRGLLLIDPSGAIGRQIVQQIVLACEIPRVALYVRGTGELYHAGLAGEDVDFNLRESAVRSAVLKDATTSLIVTPVRLGGAPIGSLALSGSAFSDAALQSLLTLVAITLERANSQKAVTQAEVARQNEELKSTLLDAIAHEFKTPLTSIKAVTSDLLSGSPAPLQPAQHEMISMVDESADRLSKLVSDAIELARIEGGTFRLKLGVHFTGSLIGTTLRQMRSVIDDRRVDVAVPDNLPPVRVDAGLIQVALTQLLDNALKYSPPEKTITVGARDGQGRIIVYVADRGPGIAPEEQAQIFDKFYRGRNERRLQGTGMGLAIARKILRAHGEDISVISSPGAGSEFYFGLPIAPGGAPQ